MMHFRHSWWTMTLQKAGAPLLFGICLVGALSGCAAFHRCGSSSCADDEEITNAVKTSFQRHSELQAPNQLSVRTQNHVVYLDGWVSAGVQRREAESIALDEPGVIRVVNLIAVTH